MWTTVVGARNAGGVATSPAFNANASRGLTTTPVSFSIPAGANVARFLDSAFTTRIPDPAQRAEAVEQFLSKTGLPPTLASPVSYYGASILLTDAANVSYAILGVRNALTFSLFYLKQRPISGTGDVLPPALQGGPNDNTQTGANALWSLLGTPSVAFTAAIEGYRTGANPPLEGTTRQGSLRLLISSLLSARTSVYAGARYQELRSDVATDYREAAAFVGVGHKFE